MHNDLRISLLQELSSSLSSLTIGDNKDLCILEKSTLVINELLSYNNEWEKEDANCINDLIRSYVSKLSDFYDVKFARFDNVSNIDVFDKKYDIRLPINDIDYHYIIVFVQLFLLQFKVVGDTYQNYAKKTICNILGRFLALFYGSIKVDITDFQTFKTDKYYSLLKNTLKCLALYDWSIDETIYLRLTLLNLLDVLGEKSDHILRELWISICKEITDEHYALNEYTANLMLQVYEKYYQSINTNKIIEPLDTTWLYAYIYKVRYGYIYCKKITRSNINPCYPFTFKATALCFKGLIDRIAGNGTKVVLFEKGVIKRSSEYRPLESSFLFNYTSMKFE